jgi:CO/xanthine dehydrogenase Mo-binding subunit
MTDVMEKPEFRVVGTRPVRPDGVDKVTGKAAYGADMKMPGMLHARIKRSPHAHARIVSIDVKKALALKGVKAVITSADFPELDPSIVAAGGEAHHNMANYSANCMARGKAVYEGHAVAAVAATSPSIARQAMDLIEVVYEPLPHVTDVLEAMKPDAPLLHDNMFTQGLPEAPATPSNIAKYFKQERGNLEEGFASADLVFEQRYTTQPVHQGYIEPHACVASVSADGQATVWCSSQGQFMVRDFSAKIVGMNQADLRVIPAEIGGGFGGKTVVYLEPLAIVLSRKAGRPVKIVMSRDEVFRATGPTSGCVIDVKLGVMNDGRIVAGDVDLKFQAGGFAGSPVMAATMTALASYDVPHARVTGWDIVTNTPKVAAYRAPAAPNAAFAVESALDEIARELGMDPMTLREINAVRNGMTAIYGAPLQHIGLVETLDAIKQHPHYDAPLGPNQGRGLAVGFWFNGGGESSVTVSINPDGSVSVATGTPDIGGSRASAAMMVAEALGVPYETVRPIVADTASVGFNEITGGSRVTFSNGLALVRASQHLVDEIRLRAGLMWDVPADQVHYADGIATCLAPDRAEAPLLLAEIADKAAHFGGPLSKEVALNADGVAPCFGVHLCDVEVDPDTGNVTVLRYTAAQDVGKAIHPSYVEGQIQGGAAQGIGWALNEEYVFNAKGQMENSGFLDYRMPIASDLPMIDTIMVEVPNPVHPYGVKGVGEVPIVPPLAAVANAVRDAIGKRICDLPLSPTRIHAAMAAG